MSKRSRVVLATEADLQKDFGSGRLLIGFPVRPTDESYAEYKTWRAGRERELADEPADEIEPTSS